MKKFYFTLLVASVSLTVKSGNENNPLGARSSSMGHASVALSDVWSTQNNQAGLGFLHTISTGIYYENRFLLKEISTRAASCAFPIKGGTFGLCFSNFGYALYNENKYSLSFAKIFGDKLSASVAMDYLSTKIAEGYGNKKTFVAEIGLQAKPLKNLLIGAHVFNLSRAKLADYNNERIPTIMRLGANYTFSDKVMLAIETQKDISQKAIFKAGIEYKAVKELYLRTGISTKPAISYFGFGLHLKDFVINLSANYHQTLGISPQLDLVHVFKKKK